MSHSANTHKIQDRVITVRPGCEVFIADLDLTTTLRAGQEDGTFAIDSKFGDAPRINVEVVVTGSEIIRSKMGEAVKCEITVSYPTKVVTFEGILSI